MIWKCSYVEKHTPESKWKGSVVKLLLLAMATTQLGCSLYRFLFTHNLYALHLPGVSVWDVHSRAGQWDDRMVKHSTFAQILLRPFHCAANVYPSNIGSHLVELFWQSRINQNQEFSLSLCFTQQHFDWRLPAVDKRQTYVTDSVRLIVIFFFTTNAWNILTSDIYN